MVDKPYKEDENKEYQPYDESQDVQYDFKEEVSKKKVLSKFRAKPVLSIVVIIIVVGVIYKAVQVVTSGNKEKPVSVATQQHGLPTINKPSIDELAKQQAAKQQAAKRLAAKQLAAKESEQEGDSKKSVAQLRQMQQQTQQHLASVDQSLQQVSNQLNAVATQMGGLSAQVKTLEAVAAQQAKTKAQQQKKQDAVTRTKMNYFVQAVIPGRAWLKSPNGQSLTVAAGDTIPGYGKVLSIDSYSGTVVTSSGQMIQYGINEK